MKILLLILVFLELHANNLEYQRACIDGHEYLTTCIVKSGLMNNPIMASTIQIMSNNHAKKCNYIGIKKVVSK